MKNQRGFAHILIPILIITALGGAFFLYKAKMEAPRASLEESAAPDKSPDLQSPFANLSTVDKNSEKIALDIAAKLNQEIEDYEKSHTYKTYTENGMSFLIPSDWNAIQTDAPKGQIFSSGDKSIVIAVHTSSKDCFKTLQEFLNGIKELGGYDITSEEKVIRGVTTYVTHAKINDPNGRALSVTTYLYKGAVNNYEFSIINMTDTLLGSHITLKIVDSTKVADNQTTTKALSCKQ